jgi:hypothetical protein
MKVAAIVFAVLTVISVGLAVYMFTQQSDLQARIDDATRVSRQANESAAQAKGELATVGKEVIGTEADLAGITAAVDRVKKTVTDNPEVKKAKVPIPADAPLVKVLDGLFGLFTAKVGEVEDLTAQRNQLNDQIKTIQEDAAAKAKAFEEKTAELTGQYEALTKESEKFRNEANAKIQELQDARNKDREEVAKEIEAATKAKEAAEAALKGEKKRSEDLLTQLAQFKPTGGLGSVLQIKDGTIVRTVPGNDVVYIGLGRRDGVRPGMTFSVYSPVRGIPADGKGKATIEVTSVFETTSECRVTSQTRGEPILSDDIIANPVFDKARQFHFVVAGDFDLNFDGKIDDPGGKQVARLIERLGGKVMDHVDSNTDFVVLGAPPPLPSPASATETDPAAAERAAQLKQQHEAFETVLNEARTLSIPILTRTQFLHFLGYAMPSNVPDDTLPTM